MSNTTVDPTILKQVIQCLQQPEVLELLKPQETNVPAPEPATPTTTHEYSSEGLKGLMKAKTQVILDAVKRGRCTTTITHSKRGALKTNETKVLVNMIDNAISEWKDNKESVKL